MSLPISSLIENGSLWFGSSNPTFQPPAKTKPLSASFGIPSLDQALPDKGLLFGGIHEWALEEELSSKRLKRWHPPLFLLTSLIGNALASQTTTERKLIAWVGRKSWPTPNLIEKTIQPQEDEIWNYEKHCLFFDPPDRDKRLWIISQLFRCPAVLVVVADASEFNLIATRRLRLAAKENAPLAILLRPPWEILCASAAHTKWKIAPAPSDTIFPKWSLELIRSRGLVHPTTWFLEAKEEKQNGKISFCLAGTESDERSETCLSSL